VERRVARLLVLVALAAGCGGSGSKSDQAPEPAPTLPLPTAGMAGQPVAVYPVTLISADEALGWQPYLGDRHEALAKADSIIGAMLVERSPEVTWVLPAELRRAVARSPGTFAPPDQMGTALLRGEGLKVIPDPLRSQMRSLNAVVADRFAFVPAALLFRRNPEGKGEADLVVVLADVRTGLIGWRTVAHGTGEDPWLALRAAFKTLTPELP